MAFRECLVQDNHEPESIIVLLARLDKWISISEAMDRSEPGRENEVWAILSSP